nr:MAG TPA_asm: hypothetical protein [Caudoviricetes sp.]
MQQLIIIAAAHQLPKRAPCSMTAFITEKLGRLSIHCLKKGPEKSERKGRFHSKACCKEKALEAATSKGLVRNDWINSQE